jgi:hypothetical protein
MLNRAWLLGGRDLVDACAPALDILLDDRISDEECLRKLRSFELPADRDLH